MSVGLADRVLGLAGSGKEREALASLHALRLYLLLHSALELLHYALRWDPVNAYFTFLLSGGLGLTVLLTFQQGRARLANGLGAALVLLAIVRLFPGVSNHFFLIFVCLSVLAFLDLEKAEDALLALQTCRLVTVIVLFYTGFQKVLLGTYFKGQFFAWTIGAEPRFSGLLGLFLSRDEVAALEARVADPIGETFVLEQPLLLLVSNGVYVFEMLAPLLLLHPRTRRLALPITLAFLVAIELGAREILFGMVFVNLLLLFSRENWVRRTLPLWLLIHAVLLASRLGWLPEWSFN